MNLKELDSFSISDAISFHDELNPNLWDGQSLQPKVKEQLLLIAKDFLEELGVDDLDVQDITVSGSNAAYSYTPHSDLDLHILVDLSKLDNNEIYKELFNAKKIIYNDTHNIKIHGVPVELYVQDSREPVVSLGEYSILQDKWLRIPTKRRANLDQTATKQKYEKLLDIIRRTLKSKNIIQVNKIIQKIKQYRKAGLDKGGEFGPENLAYKILRKQGLIDKLYNLRDKLHSETLTIEDYDPNGPPPGPEFKPTMPKGTVRVDVSDVYDWYKLGQHISNMKGLGKHDFGKGPPSTILSFGDEDLEHQYIKALQKTGLSTTDIDPVDPKQPKGMKRQKVDPTFNVNENKNQQVSVQDILIYLKKVMGTESHEDWRNDIINNNEYFVLKDIPLKSLWIDLPMLDKANVEKYKKMDFSKAPPIVVGSNGHIIDGYHRANVAKSLGIPTLKAWVGVKKQGVAEGKIKLSTDPNWYGAEVGDYKASGPIVNIPASQLVGFEPDDKMNQPKSKANVEKIIDGLKKGAKLPPLLVRKYKNGYQVLDGHHRFWAYKLLNFKSIPAQIVPNNDIIVSEASGYIPSEKEKNDPRFKTALTVDVRPNTMKNDAKKFGNKISRAGIPPTLNPNGKF